MNENTAVPLGNCCAGTLAPATQAAEENAAEGVTVLSPAASSLSEAASALGNCCNGTSAM